MELRYNKGNYYVCRGNDNILIDRDVFGVFDIAYRNEVSSHLEELLFCNGLIRLRNLGYDIRLNPDSERKRVGVAAFDRNGEKMTFSALTKASQTVMDGSSSRAIDEDKKQNETIAINATNEAFKKVDDSSANRLSDTARMDSSKVNGLSGDTKKMPIVSSNLDDIPNDFDMNCYKVRVVKAPKKLKTKGKIFRKISKTFICMLLAGAAAIGSVSAYNSYITERNSAADQDTYKYVEDHTVDGAGYATNPFVYEGNTKAYLKSDTLFASNNGVLPVGQYDNNEYGLKHNIAGEESVLGTIAKDYRNSEGLSDDFTIIYGHNIVGNHSVPDSMFGKVADYANTGNPNAANNAEENYKMAPSFEYYDEYGHYEMDIFASAIYDSSEIINWVGNFKGEGDFNAKMNTILASSNISGVVNPKVMPEYGDKIVCLFTCPYFSTEKFSNENNRVLVFAKAKQIEKYKDKEAVSQYKRL